MQVIHDVSWGQIFAYIDMTVLSLIIHALLPTPVSLCIVISINQGNKLTPQHTDSPKFENEQMKLRN